MWKLFIQTIKTSNSSWWNYLPSNDCVFNLMTIMSWGLIRFTPIYKLASPCMLFSAPELEKLILCWLKTMFLKSQWARKFIISNKKQWSMSYYSVSALMCQFCMERLELRKPTGAKRTVLNESLYSGMLPGPFLYHWLCSYIKR